MAQRSVSDGLPKGARRGAKAADKLVKAYLTVFQMGREEVEIVLADLAEQSGFYKVTPPGEGDNAYTLAFNEGKRSAFAHIFSLLRMTPEEIRDLETAARYEAAVSAEEGSL